MILAVRAGQIVLELVDFKQLSSTISWMSAPFGRGLSHAGGSIAGRHDGADCTECRFAVTKARRSMPVVVPDEERSDRAV